jgi:hypothetical protein
MLWLGIWIALIATGGVKKEIIAYNGNIGICLRAFWLALAEFWTDKIDQFGERHSYWYAQELKCKLKSRKTYQFKIYLISAWFLIDNAQSQERIRELGLLPKTVLATVPDATLERYAPQSRVEVILELRLDL